LEFPNCLAIIIINYTPAIILPPKLLRSRHGRPSTSSMCLGASTWVPWAVVPRRVALARGRDTHCLAPCRRWRGVRPPSCRLGLYYQNASPYCQTSRPWLPSSNYFISVLNRNKEQLLQALMRWKSEERRSATTMDSHAAFNFSLPPTGQ
jgi:hypothetical protein